MPFSSGVEKALRAALEAHAGQRRKSPGAVPYVSHPVHVALMLARLGRDEAVIQAGLLHDVVEDCPGWSHARLEAEFGPRVAGLVAELSEDKSRSWAERKETAIARVPALSPDAATIQACDKLHNLEALLTELRTTPDEAALWARFRGGRAGTLAMARGLVAALAPRVPGELAAALCGALRALEAVAR
ncbi:MAG: HD domain-containing protein [Planctomycetota bacterium]